MIHIPRDDVEVLLVEYRLTHSDVIAKYGGGILADVRRNMESAIAKGYKPYITTLGWNYER